MRSVGKYVLIKRTDLLGAGALASVTDPFKLDRSHPMEGVVLDIGDTCKEVELLLARTHKEGLGAHTIKIGDTVQYWGAMAASVDTGDYLEGEDTGRVLIKYHAVPFDNITVIIEPEDLERRAQRFSADRAALDESRRRAMKLAG